MTNEYEKMFSESISRLTIDNIQEMVSNVWISDTGACSGIDHAVILLDKEEKLEAEEMELYGSCGRSIVTITKDNKIVHRFFGWSELLEEIVAVLEHDYEKGSSLVAGTYDAIESAQSDKACSSYHPTELTAYVTAYEFTDFNGLVDATKAQNANE